MKKVIILAFAVLFNSLSSFSQLFWRSDGTLNIPAAGQNRLGTLNNLPINFFTNNTQSVLTSALALCGRFHARFDEHSF